MIIKYPRVHMDKTDQVYVSFYIGKKRYRLFNGKKIGLNINPNSFPKEMRIAKANILADGIYNYLISGGSIHSRINEIDKPKELSDFEYLELALMSKRKSHLSSKYFKTLEYLFQSLTSIMSGNKLNSNHLKLLLDRYVSGVSYNTNRRHLSVLINEAIALGMNHNPIESIKPRKSISKLNKPYDDIELVLDKIKSYNKNLHLCCLLTYGCLLRPHREVRELKWNDFSDDLRYIKLEGSRTKSGKNRIVPVPDYVRKHLIRGEGDRNIFTGDSQAPNQDYFKTLWGRFKSQSQVILPGQTLYSFRHSGAIEIFNRSGSLVKVQKALGHSSLNTSLIYLRGLNIESLKEEDMPTLKNDNS